MARVKYTVDIHNGGVVCLSSFFRPTTGILRFKLFMILRATFICPIPPSTIINS